MLLTAHSLQQRTAASQYAHSSFAAKCRDWHHCLQQCSEQYNLAHNGISASHANHSPAAVKAHASRSLGSSIALSQNTPSNLRRRSSSTSTTSNTSTSTIHNTRQLQLGPGHLQRKQHAGLQQQQQQQHNQTPVLHVGEQVQVTCVRLGTGGVGVCLWGASRLVLLIQGALPGELLTACITAVKKGYAEGVKLATITPHHSAVEARCSHFGTCGGCTLQSLQYMSQLQHKVEYVQQLFVRIGKLSADDVAAARKEPAAALPELQYRYRNKIQLAFSTKVWRKTTNSDSDDSCGSAAGSTGEAVHQGRVVDGWGLGFYLPGSNSVVMPLQECHLVRPEANQVITAVRQVCQQVGLLPYDPSKGQGLLRHLIIRSASGAPSSTAVAAAASSDGFTSSSSSSNNAADGSGSTAKMQLMAIIVTTEACKSESLQPVADWLIAHCSGLVSVVHSMQTATTAASNGGPENPESFDSSIVLPSSTRQSITGRQRQTAGQRRSREQTSTSRSGAQALRLSSTKILAGVPYLTEQLCGLMFHISPHSFFQTNTYQAQNLYEQVIEAVRAYGNANNATVLDLYCGTGTIALCLARYCEQVQGFDVSASAIADARANADRNGISNAQYVCGDLNQVAEKGLLGRAEVVVVDPARAGLARSVVGYLLNCGAKRVVYVSCNAATLARDLQLLCGGTAAVSAAHQGKQPWRQTGGKGSKSSSAGTAESAGQAISMFRLLSWATIDMFPQTDHVETVVVLDRVSAA